MTTTRITFAVLAIAYMCGIGYGTSIRAFTVLEAACLAVIAAMATALGFALDDPNRKEAR